MGLWWATKGIETALMISGGLYFCRMRELRPIEFGMGTVYEMVSTTEAQASEPQEQENETVQNGGQL